MERQACFILTDFHQQLARLFLLFPDGVRDIHTLEVPTYLALPIMFYA